MLRGRFGQLHFYQSRILVALGGRGAGKTRMGAEWTHALVNGFAPFAGSRLGRYSRLALIGENLNDAREVMVEGESGLIAVAAARPDASAMPRFEATRRRVVWPNGAVAQIFSSEDPESLRGPQFDAAWCDETAKWKNAEATWDMLQFGLRLGTCPRIMVTTTPRPTKLMKRILVDAGAIVKRMPTIDNQDNLAPGFVTELQNRYGGSVLARQELGGEMIEDSDGALWGRDKLEACLVRSAPPLRRIVVGVDPPATSHRSSDACGIVAAGIADDGMIYVLADASRHGARPHEWARTAVDLYHQLEADCLLAEVNQGGDMVTAVIRTVDDRVAVKPAWATQSKRARAEPVSSLYAVNRVRHVGRFPELEDEMCSFGPDGLPDGRSPDRLDAMVWAVSELALRGRAEPRVRGL